MLTLIRIVALAGYVVVACRAGSATTSLVKPTMGATQAKVLAVALEEATGGRGIIALDLTTAVPLATLSHYENRRGGGLSLPSNSGKDVRVNAELWRIFRHTNAQPSQLSVVPAVSGVLSLSSAALHELLPDASPDAWKRFQEKVSGLRAVVTVTVPAVNGDSAMLYMTISRGPLSGEGFVCLFRRSGQNWRLSSKHVVIAN